MTTKELLDRYEALCLLSAQMRDAARRAEWDTLIELELSRGPFLEVLQETDLLSWPPEQAHKKVELIKVTLDNDAETRAFAQARLQDLRATIGSIDTEKKLNKAYEAV